ncbi:MAG TPA: tripartite tricarboxylate transporter substrate-binding protein, partial [Pseudolabrys sp.]|nr:tripartite tricarboxylate transporter substrate-binding protein [Pseudolabrys sp.]
MLTRRHLLATAGAAAVSAAAPQAGAQSTYASQPVHILVGYAAGGGVDIIARLLQDPMKAALGQPIIVENRAGASAMLATGAVAKAAPDGYTLLACASGEVAINHFLFKEKMAYDPAKELVPIALVGIVPCVVVVASTTPVQNPKELIAYIKANPGKLSFSSSGIGNPQQLAGELMNTMAGTKVLHVPYRGAAPAVTDVATGAVTMSFSSLAAALPLIQAGKIRAVAVTSRERMPQLPDVAPLSEGSPGLADYEQLVRHIRHRRHTACYRWASQRHCEHCARGSGHFRQTAAAGYRAKDHEGRGVQGFRGCRAHKIRKDRGAGQHQVGQ